jgi:hypothetical protein
MDILGVFRDFGIASIFKYMGIEFLMGAVIGLVIKQLTIFNSRNASNTQIVSAKEYTATYPDGNLLKHPFDLFLLTPEFVVLKTENGVISREEFYTFFGASMIINYENGMKRYGGGSALTAPIYLCTVVVPSVVGFFTSLLPFIGQYFSPLLYSGLVWMFLTFLLQPFTGMLNRVQSNPE